MLSLHVTYYINPKDLDAFLEAIKPAWDGVVKEPNFRFFDLFTGPNKEDPEILEIQLVELWECTPEWFMAEQMTKPYYGPYLETTKAMHVKDPYFKFLERRTGWSAIDSKYLEGVQRR